MKILVSGSRGMVGRQLCAFLAGGGHTVLRLMRAAAAPSDGPNTVRWEATAGTIDEAAMEGLDVFVHLAGENIAARRWSTAQKRKIKDSRVLGTRQLCEILTRLRRPPKVVVSASAIGYYGDRGDTWLDESSAKGAGFLADVCEEWEHATDPARDRGLRVVQLRFGVILSAKGGALAKMLTPFSLGLGGVIGSGQQSMSWVSLDDAVGAIHHALQESRLSGPVNVVSPNPVTNREFTRTLGKVLGRPTIFPMPAFAARLAFGEMADELLLSSQRVKPGKLVGAGYLFLHNDLEAALRHTLGK